jgi:acyl-CoA synthetase (AMP-forming)/AMP-acid ligase II
VNPRQVLPAAHALGRSGLLWPIRPWDYLRMVDAFRQWGTSLATGSAIAAFRAPDQAAIVDDEGVVTWRELDRSADAAAGELRRRGVGEESVVALMCRNHRLFVEAALGVSKLGADLVPLNTEFAAAELRQVLGREGIVAIVLDDEFAGVVEDAGFAGARIRLRDLRRAVSDPEAPAKVRPAHPGRVVIMTSGTTGAPKGAQRNSVAPPLDAAVSAFLRLPLRAREPVVVAPPLFHALGFGFFGFALALQGTLVLQRRFDPEEVLAAVADHRATTLVVVPVMLRRILALPAASRARYDTSSLRVILCSGSSLSAGLAAATMDAFGDVLYNLYGSTEAGWVAMATPSDLRGAPGTAGRPPAGTTIAVLDDRDQRVPRGRSGRIFVRSGMTFDGYTGGGGKQVVDGMMSTGDIGYLDDAGRLYVHGRDDDMIISGGENVFPEEVEDLLRDHDDVADAAVVGVDDDEMGQRLAAFVVARPGSSLSEVDIKTYVRSRLARFKVPRQVEFVDTIPRNATGKVLRRLLRGWVATGTGGVPPADPGIGVAPSTWGDR